jgi:putative nucleotidyltransferase with HDIG domain
MEQEKSLIDIIQSYLNSDNVKLPVFSSTALRIQNEISKEEPDARLIEKLIISDQALTSSVLKHSNSSFYKGFTEVSTVKQAMVRLGINEVSNIVIMISQENNFRSKDPFVQNIMSKLWRHSVGCAIGASWLSKNCSLVGLTNEVFVAALLHDIGKLLILKVIDELKHAGELNGGISDEVLNEAMNTLHTDLGYTLMRKWNLPETYSRVVRDHHLEEIDSNNLPLIIVRLSDKGCNKLGIGVNSDPSIVLAAMPEAEMMNLSEIDIAKLEIKLEDSKLLNYS